MNLTCPECRNEYEGKPNFCPECGNKLNTNNVEIEEKFRRIEKEENPSKNSESVRNATTILVLTLVLVLLLSILPITKVTSNEEKYSVYYNTYLEKLEGSDAKAPRELIENHDLEEIYLERISNSQMGLLLMMFYCIVVISYGSLYQTSKELNVFTNKLFKKIYIIIICYILYNSSCFIGLSFEKYVEDNIVIMPLISMIYIIYAIVTLKILSNKNNETEYRVTNYRLNYIFESAIFSLIFIPVLPWVCATYSDIENPEALIYTDTSILAYKESIFGIYELELLANNLSNIYLFLWGIVILSIIGEIGIFLNEMKKYKSTLTEILSISHNLITLATLLILYMHFMFFLNVEKLEEYVNEIANSGESNINYAFTPNYFSLFISITILYQSLKLNYKELKKRY